MRGLVILSHGLDSGPEATKVSALADAARELGWGEVRPDYRDLDASRDPAQIEHRIERLLRHVPRDETRVVLAGSSMGAFISGFASLRVRVRGLFLMAPPLQITGYPFHLDIASVPTEIVHAWQDELIDADEVVIYARAVGATLHLVEDGHRLSAHVEPIADWFRRFLVNVA
jgi:pimeloyl-ACP methyl ester carboxylesterase